MRTTLNGWMMKGQSSCSLAHVVHSHPCRGANDRMMNDTCIQTMQCKHDLC